MKMNKPVNEERRT